MARIEPIHQQSLSPSIKVAFERHLLRFQGCITNMQSVLCYSLPAFEAYMQWYPLYEELEKLLGERMARLYAYSISGASDCTVCSTFFRKLIIQSGENPDSLQLSLDERKVVDFGSSIAKCKGNIADHVYNSLSYQYSKNEMVLLVAFAGQMIATSVFNNVVEIDMDPELKSYQPAVISIWRNKA